MCVVMLMMVVFVVWLCGVLRCDVVCVVGVVWLVVCLV